MNERIKKAAAAIVVAILITLSVLPCSAYGKNVISETEAKMSQYAQLVI